MSTEAPTDTPVEFDLTPISVRVMIGGKGYLLKEASGEAAARYKNSVLENTTLDPVTGGVCKLKNMGDLEAFRVHLSLFHTTVDGNEGPQVPLAVVRKWPDRVIKGLLVEIRKVSPQLNIAEIDGQVGDTAEVKKSQSDTEDGYDLLAITE